MVQTSAEVRTSQQRCIVCRRRQFVDAHRVMVVARPLGGGGGYEVFSTPHKVCPLCVDAVATTSATVALRASEAAMLRARLRDERGWPGAEFSLTTKRDQRQGDPR